MKQNINSEIRQFLLEHPERLNKLYADSARLFNVSSEKIRNIARTLRSKAKAQEKPQGINDDRICELIDKFQLNTDYLRFNHEDGLRNFILYNKNFSALCFAKKISGQMYYSDWICWGKCEEFKKELEL